MFRLPLLLLAALLAAVPARAADWPPILVDPSSKFHGAADLILPLPCGGGMAFQRISVPIDLTNPLADRGFRMGQSEGEAAFSDYLKPTYLRGAFDDPKANVSYFYMSRYELNEAQYRALRGDCDTPFKPVQARAKGGLSWFDAVDLSRAYTVWLMQNARDVLPRQGDRMGFLRLPTEAEWEYAARGGARADAAAFAARRFFSEGALSEYAAYLTPGSGAKGLAIIGARRRPNPLGLLDIYGNAEELMLEPFRMNAIGRAHGQPGGLVTRGGSADLEESQIYTARRSEYPLFNPQTGTPLAGEYFGARFVLSAVVVSDDRYDVIRDSWHAEADRPTADAGDPLSALNELLDEELDPRRKQALSDLQLEFRLSREAAAESLFQSTKSTLLSGAAFVETLLDGSREITRLTRDSLALRDTIAVTRGNQRAQLMQTLTLNVDRLTSLRARRDTYLLSYRSTLETLASDVDSDTRDRAFASLTQDLTAAQQNQLMTMLNRFWEDLPAFLQSPDMERPQLLQLALD
jgi:hypothetical protein